MQDQIPPAPPSPPQPLPYASPRSGKTCPRCGVDAAAPVGFTLWGGVLGPKLLNHHKCAACKYTFNAKTGRPNTAAITIYLVVSTIVAIIIFFLIVAVK